MNELLSQTQLEEISKTHHESVVAWPKWRDLNWTPEAWWGLGQHERNRIHAAFLSGFAHARTDVLALLADREVITEAITALLLACDAQERADDRLSASYADEAFDRAIERLREIEAAVPNVEKET